MKKLNKKGKKILLSVTALVLVAAIGFGIWFGTRNSGDPIPVYSFDYVGMTEYWGDTQESYGPVTTDRIQTVFLSDTQTVTEVKVKEGDTVKKGDILLSFDTTLSDLQLERKRLTVEKEKLQLDALNAELDKIRNMKPMTPMDDWNIDIPEPSQGTELKEPYKYLDYMTAEHDGKSMAGAFVCRLRTDAAMDNALYEAMRRAVWGEAGICEHDVWEETCPICHCPHGLAKKDCPICNLELCEHEKIKGQCPECECEHGYQRGECPLCSPKLCSHGYISGFCPVCHEDHTDPVSGCGLCEQGICPHFNLWATCPECNKTESEGSSGEDNGEGNGENNDENSGENSGGNGSENSGENGSATPPAPEAEDLRAFEGGDYEIRFLSNETPSSGSTLQSYYVIFKMTEGNMDLGPTIFWQGAFIQGHDSDFRITLFTPTIEDYTLPEEEETEIEGPSIDFGSGYTAAEISKMRKEQEKKIREQDLKTRMAEAEYKIMQRELNDGNIYADFDGKVVSLLTEEESREQEQPMVKVSGGGGFYITGSVSELEKDNLQIGQEVTVNDWRSGGMYTGTVESIGDFPNSGDGWSGIGNPTATYYPFTAFVDGEANLQSGNYVSIQYSTSGSTSGIYLQKAFIRTEKGESYVLLQGEGDRLEKRTITTGKSLWGSYLEVLEGITVDDKIAFPYGKDVKEGAKTVEGDISSLYGY